ncbi:unnamed protein product, partial [Pylaiella littoralis]
KPYAHHIKLAYTTCSTVLPSRTRQPAESSGSVHVHYAIARARSCFHERVDLAEEPNAETLLLRLVQYTWEPLSATVKHLSEGGSLLLPGAAAADPRSMQRPRPWRAWESDRFNHYSVCTTYSMWTVQTDVGGVSPAEDVRG